MTHKQITNGLLEVGACYATTPEKCVLPNDGFDAKPTYHVHPDASYPHQDSIIRFDTLDELAGYVRACKSAAAATSESQTVDIMQSYWMSRY